MNIFGINGGELIVLIVLALLLLGPEKIPQYLRTLREWIHKIRVLAEGAKEQFKEETGTDFDEVDWQKYDPRQYDPRRVIREALSEPIEDLEASLHDAKNTVEEAADVVANKPVPQRPALTHEQIMAAAVPIDQLDQQQAQFPDPNQPPPITSPALEPMPESTATTLGDEHHQTALSAPDAQPAVKTATDQVGTPFDSEAT